MSIYTDMINATLQKNEPKKGVSGAPKDNWLFVENIDIAIYKNDSFKSNTSAKYEQSTHSGITFFKGFIEGTEYRLLIGLSHYEITDFNTKGRFSTLLLKRIYMYEQ